MWTTPDSSTARPIVRVTRRYRFSAAHRLHAAPLTDAENRAVYGKCNNPHGHGHDYALELTVRGELDPRLGRLIPIPALDEMMNRIVLHPMDRRNLNLDVPEFATLVPTTENLAAVVAARVAAAWPLAFPGSAAVPEKVKIWETKRNIFEVPIHGACSEDGPMIEAAQTSSLVKEAK